MNRSWRLRSSESSALSRPTTAASPECRKRPATDPVPESISCAETPTSNHGMSSLEREARSSHTRGQKVGALVPFLWLLTKGSAHSLDEKARHEARTLVASDARQLHDLAILAGGAHQDAHVDVGPLALEVADELTGMLFQKLVGSLEART